MLAFLTSRLAGPIAAGLALLLAVTLVVTRVELAGSRHHAEALDREIHAPGTGWAARLGRCEANTAQLTAQLQDQSARTHAFAERMSLQIAQADALRQVAERARAGSEAKAARLLSGKSTGDACRDLAVADSDVLEALK